MLLKLVQLKVKSTDKKVKLNKFQMKFELTFFRIATFHYKLRKDKMKAHFFPLHKIIISSAATNLLKTFQLN